MTPPIVVARANDISFLGHIRTCMAHGISPTLVCHTWDGAAKWHSEVSCCFSNPFRLPNPVKSESRYVDELVTIGCELAENSGEVPFCIPSSDTNLEVFLRNRKTLLPHFRLMGAQDWSDYPVAISDKLKCTEVLMSKLPENVPRSAAVTHETDLDEFTLPVIIKPIRKDYSQSFYQKHGGLKALRVDTREEIARVFAACEKDASLLIQEYIPFEGKYAEIPFYLYADSESNVRVAATGIKEHLQPAPFGTATVLRLSYHPQLLSLAQDVAKCLQWRGPLMIEFIQDRRNGNWKVIEINTRPWLFHRFYSRHGLDFVGTFLRDVSGKLSPGSGLTTPPPELVGETGIDGPIHVDTQRVLQDDFLQPHEGLNRIHALKDWLRQFSDDFTDPFFEPDDPAPAISRSDEIAASLGIKSGIIRNEFGWL